MNKGKKLYEGKAKIIYATSEKDLVIQHFKDDATAFNALKKANIEGKGVLNNRISEHLLNLLSQCGIKTHLIKRLNMREQLIRKAEIFPIEFIVRNIATGSLTKRLGISEGTVLEKPLLEYCYKNDELQDPIIAKEHIYSFGWATENEMKIIDKMTLRINDLLLGMFRGIGIKLVDFKIEYGKIWNKETDENEIHFNLSLLTKILQQYVSGGKLLAKGILIAAGATKAADVKESERLTVVTKLKAELG
jgi:phosphoribosylaminoimidazole-succinocarboxamide synthase